MKYHCDKCGIHFDYPKHDAANNNICPKCGAPAIANRAEDDTNTSAPSSVWGTVAKVILGADIIGAVLFVLVNSDGGIKWALVGEAVAEVALVALICGIVMLLSSIDTTLKVIGAQHRK